MSAIKQLLSVATHASVHGRFGGESAEDSVLNGKHHEAVSQRDNVLWDTKRYVDAKAFGPLPSLRGRPCYVTDASKSKLLNLVRIW